MTYRQLGITLTFSLTVLVSAFLLFVVQPMVGAMVLPLLGGSSTVWTTCMLFFQVMLLAGYVYAHGIAQNLTFRRQVILHGSLILLALLFLPLSVPESLLRTNTAPAFHLLLALFFGIGLPMFVVSSSAPLFQHWFGALDHPDAEDPYYLYAASNAGSMLALLSYPFLIDRFTDLGTQRLGWTGLFLALAVFVSLCGLIVFRDDGSLEPGRDQPVESPLSRSRKGWWILITFIPSSLMLGLTHYVTTDLASVPLLWVLPLAAYLLSFILVFARLEHPLRLYRIVLPPAMFLVFALTYNALLSHVKLIGLHMVCFFLIAMYFHGELAEDRPETEHLTTFFIFVALGGSLGGLFNSLLAPVLFDTILEYYLVIALGIALGGWMPTTTDNNNYLIGLVYGGLVLAAGGYYLYSTTYEPLVELKTLSQLAVAALVLVTLYTCWKIPSLTNVILGVVFLAGFWIYDDAENVIAQERSFYGHYRVKSFDDRGRSFLHGTTEHGYQPFDDGEPVNAPTSYYHPDGPLGDIMLTFRFDRVGIGGLGIGGLAAYAMEDSSIDFFEIDPTVEKLARRYFGYLEDCGDNCEVHTGDARQLIAERPPKSYDLIIMDAYTSDAIPTHLLTKEAVQLYLSRVVETGAVIFHVSNRHLDLEGVVGAIAEEIDAASLTREYHPDLNEPHASASTYVAVGHSEQALESLDERTGWQPTRVGSTLWTDSHTNIVSVLADRENDSFSPTPNWQEFEENVTNVLETPVEELPRRRSDTTPLFPLPD